MHVQKLPNGRWAARYRAPDGKQHRTSSHATAAEARLAAEAHADDGRRVDVFREGGDEDFYYVGRYLTPDGQWHETEHGFDDADDALAEARELEQAARAGAQARA